MTSWQPIESWLYSLLKTPRRNVSHKRDVCRFLEPLEPRTLLSADLVAIRSEGISFDTVSYDNTQCSGHLQDEVHVLFSPGTSADYMAQVERFPNRNNNGVAAASESATAELSSLADGVTALAEYQATNRWSSTTTDGNGLGWGDATSITWSIVPDGTLIPGHVGEADGQSDFISFMNGIYGSATGGVTEQEWFSSVASVFDRWSEVSGLNFIYEPRDDGAALSNIASTAPGATGVRGDIRIGGHAIDGNSGTLAYNFFPNNGEMILDTSDSFFLNTTENSLRLRNVMAHEVGHGIGLAHVDPVDGTKLMEPIATTAFDGPQHDDILAVHRLYGDEFEAGAANDRFDDAVDVGVLDGLLDGRSRTIGNNSAERYVSIDGATDVDYFRFTVGAGTLLSAHLVPLGNVYPQGAVGTSASSFPSQAQNDLALSIYDVNRQLVARADRGGLGATETLTGVLLSTGGSYYAKIDGTRDAAQLYQLEFTVAAPTLEDVVDFRHYAVESYGGLQDHSGSVTIEDGGAALHLTGNRWKMIDFPYTVTRDTVLEFDFASSAEGDVHGIGFDSNTSISSGLTFRVHGTQGWGRDEFASYGISGAQHFEIPVGQFYTGKATALVFVNDHDITNPHAESIFSNVRIYERTRDLPSNVAAPQVRDDYIVLQEDSATVAFDPLANDNSGESTLSVTGVSAGSAGGAVKVGADGRIYYRPAPDYNGIETFTYTATNAAGSSQGRVTATVRPVNDPPTANDNRYSVTSGHTYRMDVLNNDSTGVDVGETLRIVHVGKGTAGGKIATDGSRITYTPATGFTGTETFTYSINDGTEGSNATASVTVRVQPPASDYLDLRDYRVAAYGGSQDAVGAALVEDSGQVVRLLGNAWKKIELPYTITPDTVLEFDFSSASQGDIHGIGFDSNNTITSSRTFRLYGRQQWGINGWATYTTGSETKHYRIPVGKYYTGQVANLFFVNDHDVRNPTAESVFRNLRLYEAPRSDALPLGSTSESAFTVSTQRQPSPQTLDRRTSSYSANGRDNARSLSGLRGIGTSTDQYRGVSSQTEASTSHRAASAAGRTIGRLTDLQDRFGFHSLDRYTLATLDQIFADLGRDA